MIAYRPPIQQARIQMGQFSPFVNPAEITGDQAPTTPPTPPSPNLKPMLVVTGLALTGLSAATAYVGISYGMEKTRSDMKRALGWTVGVIGALSGLVRLVSTAAVALMPTSSMSKGPVA